MDKIKQGKKTGGAVCPCQIRRLPPPIFGPKPRPFLFVWRGKENGFREAVGQNTGLSVLLIEIVREYTPGPSNRKEDSASALSSWWFID